MELVSASFSQPHDNIAFDDVLLERAASGRFGEAVRFWQSPGYFVTLGRTSRVSEEVLVANCEKDGIPLVRRLSGGASVLQGPGCMNYTLVLDTGTRSQLASVEASYSIILGCIASALQEQGMSVHREGISDLALGDRKVSGSAQVRKRRMLLHHGSFLLGLDRDKVSRYLAHPPREPVYRRGRVHGDFMGSLAISPEMVRKAVLSVFPADEGERGLETSEAGALEAVKRERYCHDNWTYRF